MKRIRGTAAFLGVLAGEAVVLVAARLSGLGFLWYNVIGCAAVVLIALAVEEAMRVAESGR